MINKKTANGVRTRQQAVVDQLREMIIKGKLDAGERLMEVALAEELEVSRTPIREGLIVLAEEGLVEYRPNRGYVVREFTIEEILDAYVVRETLEGLTCRLAAERGLDNDTKWKLQRCLDEGDELLSADRLIPALREPWRKVNETFHYLLLESVDNLALSNSIASVTNIPYLSSRVVHWFDEDDQEGLYRLRAVHNEHHAIFEAICEGHGYRAEMAMRYHIYYAANFIRGTYGADGAGEGVAPKIQSLDNAKSRAAPRRRIPGNA